LCLANFLKYINIKWPIRRHDRMAGLFRAEMAIIERPTHTLIVGLLFRRIRHYKEITAKARMHIPCSHGIQIHRCTGLNVKRIAAAIVAAQLITRGGNIEKWYLALCCQLTQGLGLLSTEAAN